MEDKIIDEKYLKELVKVKESAPLHIEPIIKEIEYLRKEFGESILIGISDSKFHIDIPECFRYYSIKRQTRRNMIFAGMGIMEYLRVQ